MTNQSDIKKLAEQMASSMKSFDDIKDFQKQLMQSFIDTALEAEMEEHLGYPSIKRQTGLISAMGTLKRESVATQASLRSPPQETATVALSLYLSVSTKPVFQVLMTKSSAFTPKVKPLLRLSKPSRTSTTSTSQAAWFPESLTTSWMTSPLGRTGH